jgi:hypothetical protein
MDGRRKLTARTARDGDRVLVEIADNGPGIPEPVAGHVVRALPHHQVEVVAKELGPSLRWAMATTTRTTRSQAHEWSGS